MDDLWKDFTDDVMSVSVAFKKEKCCVGRFIDSLDPEAQQLVTAALANDKFSSVALLKALKKRGYKYGKSVITYHRRLNCSCNTEGYIR
jgi:FtsZ-interacting cell division protein ZipA